MATQSVDVVVIGMGPGGEEVAARLAKAGWAVMGVEARLVGGECPYYACVPTKMMVRASDALAEAHRVDELAGSAQVRPDWAPVAGRIRAEATDHWDDTVAVQRFEKAGGHFLRGRGRVTGPGEVLVSTAEGDRVVHATRGIVLNPGTEPAVPPIEGLVGTPYWTNRDAVAVDQVPDSLIVLGGGPVGCEFAQVFARFGARVTVIEAQPWLLPGDEPEVGDTLAGVFASEHITVRTAASVTQVSHRHDEFSVRLDSDEVLSAQQLLVATGRRTDLAALGVSAVGLDDQAPTIEVDDRMRATDRVWAVGDVTGKGAYTHISVYQARIAALDILGQGGERADYRAVPRVTFTDPEAGAVGLTEAAARRRGIRVRTGLAQIPSSARGWIHQAGNEGVIKLVADADTGVLVGATSVGAAGGEVLGALSVAVHAAVPLQRLQQMIYAYPTFHRAIEDAVRDLSG